MATGSESKCRLYVAALLMTSLIASVSLTAAEENEQQRNTKCRIRHGRSNCRPANHPQQPANSSDVISASDVVKHDVVENMTSHESTNETRARHSLIRGSKQAATITRKELLKTDWCHTEPFQQIIYEEGCLKSRVLNRFCYGQCNSFFIPKSEGPDVMFGNLARPDAAFSITDYVTGHFRSCAICTPKTTDWAVVVLRCPRLSPPFRHL